MSLTVLAHPEPVEHHFHPLLTITTPKRKNKRDKMVGLKSILATAAILSQGVFASPAAPSPPALAKRGEGIHLLNCRPFGAAGSTQTWLSIVVVRGPVQRLTFSQSASQPKGCSHILTNSPSNLVLRE